MLHKLVPSSLFVRFILIIVLPIVFAQIIATYIFYNRHWESVSKNMSLSLSNDIQVIYDIEKQNTQNTNKRDIYSKIGIEYNIKPRKNKTNIKDYYEPKSEFLYNSLKNNIDLPIRIEFINDSDDIKIEIFQKDFILSFITNAKRINNSTTYIFILWMTGTNIIFILLSIIFARNQIRPIINLARAADKFGKGQQYNFSLKPAGAKEIRKAANAFIKMKERIERQINYRTEMLAGVSHDLRTPLTRMKLQLALTKNEDLVSMLEDVKDMENMINSYLDFARGTTQEKEDTVKFSSFMDKVIAPYKQQNLNLQIKSKTNAKISLKTDSIKRCFQNLFDNSFKYGNEVIVTQYIKEEDLYVEIHDNGPGIPENKREMVFQPFFRLEESRNKETGGVGLGLAITRDIISSHGGKIYFETSELLGGVKAVIILPR